MSTRAPIASTTPNTVRTAILTEYRGPTNTRGSRVRASAGKGITVSVPYDHALSAYENHSAAARALADRRGWGGEWVGGGTDRGFAFVDIAG